MTTNVIEFQENLKDITECSICRDTFKDPRILPCIHTFCKKCLEEAASKSGKGVGSAMPCPICRHEFVIPNGGIASLQKNFFMNKLIEMAKSMSPSVRLVCDACTEDGVESSVAGELPVAKMFCRNCALKLCSSCVRHHSRSRLTSSHSMMQMDDCTSVENMAEILPPDECEKHEKERLRLHCTDCQKAVCAFCFIENHSNHKWTEIEKAAEISRQRIKTNVENLSKQNSSLEGKKSELEKIKTDAGKRLTELEKLINERKNLLQHAIEKHAASLIADVAAKHRQKLKEMKLEEENIDLQLANQKSFSEYCLEMTTKGSPVDICRAEQDLNARASDLQRISQTYCQQKFEPFALRCNVTILDDFLMNKGKSFIGEIVKETAKQKATEKQDSSSGQPNSQQMSSDANPSSKNQAEKKSEDIHFSEAFHLESTRITGIAVIDNELFIATEHNSTIKVYCSKTFKMATERRITIAGLTNPEDLTASQNPKRLFVFDACGMGKIFQFSTSGVVNFSWLVSDIKCRLSIASHSRSSATCENIIIITHIERGLTKEYMVSNQAKLVQGANVLASVNFAVKLADGNFLYTSGKQSDGIHSHGIFNLKSKCQSKERMNCPEQFIVDNQERIVLIDRGNKRIIMLNSSLEFLKEIISSREGLVDPRFIAIDDKNQRLLVADYDKTTKKSRIIAVDI